MKEPDSSVDPVERHRRRLLGLAYRMLGSRADAEDVVQDAWLRWSRADRNEVVDPEAFLVRIVTRLCLDRLDSARARREVYVGPWLPEPVADAEELSPQAATELAEDLSYALLLVLDRLSPLERAAFLLHDVFDLSFREVASALGRSEAACRQLAARGRRAVRAERRPTRSRSTPAEEHRRLLSAFVEAVGTGDQSTLRRLLADDAVALTDGGGRVLAALHPIRGADRVIRLLLGLERKLRDGGIERTNRWVSINGAPALAVYLDGALDQVVSAEVEGGRIRALYTIRNPHKLAALPEDWRHG